MSLDEFVLLLTIPRFVVITIPDLRAHTLYEASEVYRIGFTYFLLNVRLDKEQYFSDTAFSQVPPIP